MSSYKNYLGHEDEICQAYIDGTHKEHLRIKYRCHFQQITAILASRGITMRTRSESKQEYKINQYYFDAIDTPEKAYLLGFLWADGSNSPSRRCMSVTLAEKDVNMLHKIKQWLGSNHPIAYSISQQGYGKGFMHVRLSIVNKRLSESLWILGMHNDKTHIIGWPNIPYDLERHFIRGYFDGDGYWTCEGRTRSRNISNTQNTSFSGVASIAVNKEFSSIFISKIFEHTGILFHSGKHASPVIVQVRTCGRLKMIRFGDWLYQDAGECMLERKYQKYLDTKTFYDQPRVIA